MTSLADDVAAARKKATQYKVIRLLVSSLMLVQFWVAFRFQINYIYQGHDETPYNGYSYPFDNSSLLSFITYKADLQAASRDSPPPSDSSYLYPNVALQLQHPRNHPRVGARDEHGQYGFVADVELVRRTIVGRRHTNDFDPEVCDLQVVDVPSRLLRPVQIHNRSAAASPRLLCAVFTHGGAVDRITGIGETWGWKCDGFFAASTVTVRDPAELGLGSIDLVHMGEESYGNMWQKTRSILAYMYEHYLDQFDYFFLCGDDAHLIVENFKAYLETLENLRYEPLHIGRTLGSGKRRIVGGGAGYALNQQALRLFNEELLDDCRSNEIISAEDRYVSRCFQSKGIYETSPVDALNRSLLQRFHPIMTLRELAGKRKRVNRTIVPEDIVTMFTYSWHLMDWGKNQTAMKRHHSIIYKQCPKWTKLAISMESHLFKRGNIILGENTAFL